jgi:predicted RNA-binding protein with EMAP domain
MTSASAQRPSPAASELPAPDGEELSGVLGLDSIEGGCAYLETADGTRYEVIYPTGWNLDRASGALRDPTGAVAAGPGDVVTVRGHVATDMVSICQIGPIWQASEVVSVE